MTEPSSDVLPRPPRPPRLAAAVAVPLVFAAHLALVAYFAPRRMLASNIPVLTDAFGLEAYRVARVQVGLHLGNHPFIYDPMILGGQMAGFVERLGTRVFLLVVPSLSRLGVPSARAFDGVIVAGHALFPLLGYAAARAFALSRRAAAFAAGLWSLLWFFDSLFHVAWFSGRMPWNLASGLVILSSALGYLATARSRPASLIASSVTLGVALLFHPVVGLFGVALGCISALRAPSLLPARRAALLMAQLAPLSVLGMPGSIARSWSSEPVLALFRVGPTQIFWDAIEVIGPGYGAPGPSRTMIRSLCLVAGGIALARFRRLDDRRFFPLALTSGGGLVLAYLAPLVHVAWLVPPYLFLVPATLAASIPAAWLLAEVPWLSLVRDGAPRVRILLGLAALIVAPRFFRTVASYVPELLPARVVRSEEDLRVSALVGLNDPMPEPLRHEPPSFRSLEVARWLSEHAAGRGRILVDDPSLAALLAVTTALHVLGPLGERGSPSSDADPSVLLASNPTRAAVAAYVQRYAVGWVVMGGRLSPLDRDDPTFERPLNVAGYRVRRVVPEPSFLVEGSGRVARTATGLISVSNASGPSVVLRFHYDPRLHCRPECRVERVPVVDERGVEADQAGFIGVRSPPPDFDVYVP